MSRRWSVACSALLLGTTLASPAVASGPPVLIRADPGLSRVARDVQQIVRKLRPVRAPLSWPVGYGESAESAARNSRGRAIDLALKRARTRESEADFDGCVREAARVLSDATEVLASQNRIAALRDLHIQIGACLATGGDPASARSHFRDAALLDESMPRIGLHREEAEKVQLEARSEVLSRAHGKVLVESDPPGAAVWLDGRKIAGRTPLSVDIRLGYHFLTLRRFRYQGQTTHAVLQPSGTLRISLEGARRSGLRKQLVRERSRHPRRELDLARAQWSRAEQLLHIRRLGNRLVFSLKSVPTGELIRDGRAPVGADQRQLRSALCRVLAERCGQPSRGVPWYVWPLAGAVVIGGVVTTAVVLEGNREFRYCAGGRGCQ